MKSSYAVTIAIAAVLTTTLLLCPFCGRRDAGDIPGKRALDTRGEKISEKEDVRKPAHTMMGKKKSAEQKPKSLHDRLEDLNSAIRENPGDPGLYGERGMVRYLLGDYRGAVADYDAAIALNPKLADANVRPRRGEPGRGIGGSGVYRRFFRREPDIRAKSVRSVFFKGRRVHYIRRRDGEAD